MLKVMVPKREKIQQHSRRKGIATRHRTEQPSKGWSLGEVAVIKPER